MTSKERAALKTQAMKLDSIFQIGKSSLTPQMVEAVRNALRARELVKVSVLKNCMDDPREIATVLSERTSSEIVQVIGKKIILYKRNYELEEKRRRAAQKKTGIANNVVHKKNGRIAVSRDAAAANNAVRKKRGKSAKKLQPAISKGRSAAGGKSWKWSDR